MTSPSGCYVSQRKRIDGFWLVFKNVHQSERANKNFFLKTPTGCKIDGFKQSTRSDWCTRTCTNQNVQIRFFLKTPTGCWTGGFKQSTRSDWCTRTCTNHKVLSCWKHPLGASLEIFKLLATGRPWQLGLRMLACMRHRCKATRCACAIQRFSSSVCTSLMYFYFIYHQKFTCFLLVFRSATTGGAAAPPLPTSMYVLGKYSCIVGVLLNAVDRSCVLFSLFSLFYLLSKIYLFFVGFQERNNRRGGGTSPASKHVCVG